jgi:hypothetical protein
MLASALDTLSCLVHHINNSFKPNVTRIPMVPPYFYHHPERELLLRINPLNYLEPVIYLVPNLLFSVFADSKQPIIFHLKNTFTNGDFGQTCAKGGIFTCYKYLSSLLNVQLPARK